MTYNLIMVYGKDINAFSNYFPISYLHNLQTLNELMYLKTMDWETIHWLTVEANENDKIMKIIKHQVLDIQ